MCYPKPGPRCSSHAYEAMEAARDNLSSVTTRDAGNVPDAQQRYKETQRDYFTTPAGLKYLTHVANTAEEAGQRSRAAKYRTALHKFSDQRRGKIVAMKVAGYEFSPDTSEKEVEKCDQCGRFANKQHTCPGKSSEHYDDRSFQDQERSDIHRPASDDFDPEKYDAIAIVDTLADTVQEKKELDNQEKNLQDQGYVLGNGSRSNCGHCGSRMRYAAVLKRTDAKEYIYVGEQCLDNRFTSDMTAQKFQELRKTSRLNREEQNKHDRINSMVDENPQLAWLTYPDNLGWASGFTQNIGNTFRNQGRLTPRQLTAVTAALETDTQRYEQKAQQARTRAKEEAEAAPAPHVDGFEFEGEVLSVRNQPGYAYNSPTVTKMLVKHKDGWKAWLTAPSSISGEVSRGKRVQLTANFQPSDDDKKFAIAKRPRKATIIDNEETSDK